MRRMGTTDMVIERILWIIVVELYGERLILLYKSIMLEFNKMTTGFTWLTTYFVRKKSFLAGWVVLFVFYVDPVYLLLLSTQGH